METSSIDRVLNKKHFYGKIMQKYTPKTSHRPLFILVNNPKQPLHARNSFKIKILKDYQKALKSQLYFFFRNQSHLMDQIMKNKRGLELVHSVHRGINPPKKHHPRLSCQAPLKFANCPSPPPPLFRQSTPLYWFFVNSPTQMSDFSVNAQNVKVFILNPILSFKSN